MKRLVLVGFVSGIAALGFSSCAYDPYYSSGYGGGYGSGYGYGGSGFSTSYFVSTGSSRWGYDPYAGAYYDYSRRCYYDPYLSGYYPVGYRPRYVVGSPHPHGWSRGSSYCPPPSDIRSYNLTNYENRGERYRSLGRSWSSNVQVNTGGSDHHSRYSDRDRDRDQRGSSGSWMGGSSGRDRDQRSPYGSRSSNSGSIFGGGDQRSSYEGRSSGSSESLRGRSSSRQPDPRSRESSQWNGNSNRGNAAPVIVPQAPRERSPQPRDGGFGGRPESNRQAPQLQKSNDDSRGSRDQGRERDRGNSGRERGEKIKGLGQG